MINSSQITTLGTQFFLVLLLNFIPWLSYAQIPQTITYQGYLSDGTGNPIQGNVDLTFSLTNSTWQEQHFGVPVNQGVFTVNLGSIVPFGNNVDFNQPHDLSVSVNGTPTPITVPNAPLSSVPYAFMAQNVTEFTLSDLLAGNNCNANEVVSWDGAQWICSPLPTSGSQMPTNCNNEEVAAWDGQTWVCSNKVPQADSATHAQTADKAKEVDEYTLSDLEATNQCVKGEVAGWDGTQWVCLPPSTSGGQMPTNCKNKEVAAWNGQTWVCSNEVPQAGFATKAGTATEATNAGHAYNATTLITPCANNQVLKRYNNQWQCSNSVPKADSATKADNATNLTKPCANNQVLKRSNNQWVCSNSVPKADSATSAVNAQNATNAVNAQNAKIAEDVTAKNKITVGGICFKPISLIECGYEIPVRHTSGHLQDYRYLSGYITASERKASPSDPTIEEVCETAMKAYAPGTTLVGFARLRILADCDWINHRYDSQ